VVLLFAIVGFAEILQHTPRSVTDDPPSLLIFPPLEAAADVIEEIVEVERVAINGLVLKLT